MSKVKGPPYYDEDCKEQVAWEAAMNLVEQEADMEASLFYYHPSLYDHILKIEAMESVRSACGRKMKAMRKRQKYLNGVSPASDVITQS